MREAWRWFGPDDPVTLDHVRQAGASEIVSALHHLPPGAEWTEAAVVAHRDRIETTPPGRTPLRWTIVESIPIPDDVKRQGALARRSIETWIASLQAVAAAGLKVVCYNFMPVVDWTRTDLDWPLPTGATALRFDQGRFAAFDLHVLQRPGAEAEYDEASRARAKRIADGFSDADIAYLVHVILSALPGSTTEPLTLDGFRERLALYRDIDATRLRRHLVEFLEALTPVADRLGVRLTIHPDDPPRPLFGLPRIASTEADLAALFEAVPARANGLCLCTGSLGARLDNDLPRIARRFASRIAFAHLRATRAEPDGSFFEADHLAGDVDMPAVLRALLDEDRTRPQADRIPFRPDHGHRMLADLDREATGNPGYTAAGRMKGLAELRGLILGLEATSRR